MPPCRTDAEHTAPTDVGDLAGRLLERRASQIRAIARRHCIGGQDHVDDAVQAGLVAFITSYRGPLDETNAWPYLARALTTQAWKQSRREQRYLGYAENMAALDLLADAGDRGVQTEVGDPAERVLHREELAAGRELLAQLPSDQLSCLWFSALGYATGEIAALLGLSERQVRKRIEKGNRHLRELERAVG